MPYVYSIVLRETDLVLNLRIDTLCATFWGMTRGTRNKNVTGNSEDRRRRKQWLLDTFGDGTEAPCAFDCGTLVTFSTLTVDRYPLPGYAGGKYTRDNIRPACAACNTADGSAAGVARKAMTAEERVSDSLRIMQMLWGSSTTSHADAWANVQKLALAYKPKEE